MSTTPTEGSDRYSGRGGGVAGTGRNMPIPLNSELLIYLLVWLVLVLIWLFDDDIGSGEFGTWTVALTFGYLISRGIAKASRVYEREQETIGR